MYEGAPNWPQTFRFWKIIDDHKVSIFYTAPTAIRAFIKWGDEWLQKYSLASCRRDIGEAMAEQVGELGFFPLWTYAHPKAIELAERLASLTQAISIASFSPPVAPRRMRVPGS